MREVASLKARTDGTAGDRFSAAVTVVAMLASLVVTFVLVSVDYPQMLKLRESRVAGTIVQAAGSLAGQNLSDGVEWVAPADNEQAVVLFGVAEAGKPGDLEFWSEVAAHSQTAAPDARFVGLCVAGRKCGLPSGAQSLLTLLKSMDPVQMHALTVGVGRGHAYFIRGSRLEAMLPVLNKDSQAFARKIGAQLRRKAKVGGA